MTLLKISSHLFEVRWIRVGPFQGCRFAPPLANVHAALRAAVLHAGGMPEITRSERAIASHSGLVYVKSAPRTGCKDQFHVPRNSYLRNSRASVRTRKLLNA